MTRLNYCDKLDRDKHAINLFQGLNPYIRDIKDRFWGAPVFYVSSVFAAIRSLNALDEAIAIDQPPSSSFLLCNK
jgi:hypothetical protein